MHGETVKLSTLFYQFTEDEAIDYMSAVAEVLVNKYDKDYGLPGLPIQLLVTCIFGSH